MSEPAVTPEQITALEQLVDRLRAKGVTRLKAFGLELELGPPPGVPRPKDDEPPKPERTLEQRLFDPLGIGKTDRARSA